MESDQFDYLTRIVGVRGSRRSALALLSALGLAGAIWPDDGAAKKKKKKKCKAPKVKCGKACCAAGQICLDGACSTASSPPPPGTCTPSCGAATCGDDGCGGSCGTCGSAQSCQGGACTCPSGQVVCGDLCVDACPSGRTVDPNTCGCCRISGILEITCDPDPCCSALDCGTGPGGEKTVCDGRTLGQPCSFSAQCEPPLSCNANLVCA